MPLMFYRRSVESLRDVKRNWRLFLIVKELRRQVNCQALSFGQQWAFASDLYGQWECYALRPGDRLFHAEKIVRDTRFNICSKEEKRMPRDEGDVAHINEVMGWTEQAHAEAREIAAKDAAPVDIRHKGLPVKGYAETVDDRALRAVNRVKEIQERTLRLIDDIKLSGIPYDPRNLATGWTDLEKGFSSISKALFQPGGQQRIALPEDVAKGGASD